MKRVRFYIDSGYVGAERYIVVEFEDDTTDEEIEECHQDWVSQYIGWYELEDGEDE